VISVGEYLSFLDGEYLRGYVDHGGAAVKFLVPNDDATAMQLAEQLSARGHDAGYLVVGIDSVATRVHLLEEVFFALAREVDWDGLAEQTARRAAADAGYPAPADRGELVLDRLATHHGVDARELKRDLDRALQHRVYQDYAMVQEFRIAMLRLCQAQLQTGQVADAEHAAVLDWLRGDLRQISALRSTLIFRRIGRDNARQMLFSLAHFLAVNGHAGLLVILDIRRLGLSRRPSPTAREGYYYTRATLLDAYEMLRQLVDNTDELGHCLVAVVAARELLDDAGRGLDAYQALKLRIFDEVRDVRRDNPFSSLVRLGAS